MRMAAAGMVLACLVTAHAAAAPPTGAPAPAQSAADALVADAATEMRTHDVARAVGQADAAIAAYKAQYRDEKRAIYSARTPAESLAYMLSAASRNGSAVAVGPGYGLAWYLRGYGMLEQNRLAEARVALEQAIALSPQNGQYLAELAYVDQRERKFDASDAGYRRCLDSAVFAPESAQVAEKSRCYRGLGYNAAERQQWDKAEALYRKALVVDPADTKSVGELRWIAAQRAKAAAAPVS